MPLSPARASSAPPRLSRRTALAGLGLAGLGLAGVGCAASGRTPHPSTDQDLVAAALRAERELLALAQATVRRLPSLRPRLRPTVAVHRDHVRVLLRAEPTVRERSGAPRPRRVGGQRRAVGALAGAERSLQAAHRAGALRAADGELARVLASMAAAAAQQASLLRPGAS